MRSRHRVRFASPENAEVIREEAPDPGTNQLFVRTKYSAVSPGTERLVYQGNAPTDLPADSTIEALQDEQLTYPISYGYACVGTVEEVGRDVDDQWLNSRVFAFQPHVSGFVASPENVIRLPDSVDSEDAVLIPSLETAVTLAMDGRPVVGERALIFGQGIIGILTARLLKIHPLRDVVAVDQLPSRRRPAQAFGVEVLASAEELESEDRGASTDRFDLVYELTGNPAALNEAIQQTGYEGRLVVGSWYGTDSASLALGGHYHRSRMKIIASQVSTIGAAYQGRWTKDRRMNVVLGLMNDVCPSQFISDRFQIEDAPAAYEKLVDDPSMLQPVFVYD
jgi:2-desacetyl-2-hydroxyethyl bacteriochlorophyllide A dehydrogenase